MKAPRVRPGFNPYWWRIRRRLRSPALYWTAALAVALLTASSAVRLVDSARRDAERLGVTGRYAVALGDLPAGHSITPDDVTLVELPDAMIPVTALTELPVGDRLAEPVLSSQLLLAKDLSRHPSSALSARLESGDRAIGVPLTDSSARVSAGDRVDVLATTEEAGGVEVISAGAEVLDATTTAVTLSVRVRDLTAVANALAAGSAQVAVRPPGQ